MFSKFRENFELLSSFPEKLPFEFSLCKLDEFGPEKRFLEPFVSYLCNLRKPAVVKCLPCDLENVFSEVIQGANFWKIHFLFFQKQLNSLSNNCIQRKLSADRKLLFTCAHIHDDLARLYNWNLVSGKLENASKTKIVVFRSSFVVYCELGFLEDF